MRQTDYPALTPPQEKEVKRAVEGTCELCSEYFPFASLEVHRISRRVYREMARDPSTRILVVCHLCHDHIHRLPLNVKAQRAIVSRRPFFIRQDIRRALGYQPGPYTPPGETDLPRMYEELFSHISPGSFRLSG